MSSVPVSVAAKVYGKDPAWVRAGIIAGWLPIGTATRNGQAVTKVSEINSQKGRINYYISPALLFKHTGFIYDEVVVKRYLSHDGMAKQKPYDYAVGYSEMTDPTIEAVLVRNT